MTASDRSHVADGRLLFGRPVACIAILAVATLSAALGCASRGIVATPSAGATENPPTGMAIHIADVRDARVFQETPNRKSTPSLTDHASESGGRARAVGRDTNAGGRPGSNVMLAAEQSVEGLVGDAAGRALRGAGFRVVDEGAPDFQKARAMNVSIEELWMWETIPALGAVTNVRLRVRLSAPLPGLDAGEVIEAEYKLVQGGFSYGMWSQTLERGLDELTQRTQVRLSQIREAMVAGVVPAASPAAKTTP
jgi:hypothetical protein